MEALEHGPASCRNVGILQPLGSGVEGEASASDFHPSSFVDSWSHSGSRRVGRRACWTQPPSLGGPCTEPAEWGDEQAWLRKTRLMGRERKGRMMQSGPQKDGFGHTPKVAVFTRFLGFPVPGPGETWLRFLPLDSE